MRVFEGCFQSYFFKTMSPCHVIVSLVSLVSPFALDTDGLNKIIIVEVIGDFFLVPMARQVYLLKWVNLYSRINSLDAANEPVKQLFTMRPGILESCHLGSLTSCRISSSKSELISCLNTSIVEQPVTIVKDVVIWATAS